MNVLITLPSVNETITFYNIDAIKPFKERGADACYIYSGGKEFLCSQSYEEVYTKLKRFVDEKNK